MREEQNPMAQRKKVLEDLQALNSLKNLAESYEEIAVVQMQKIKDSVLRTREFLTDLSDVYVDLKASYQKEIKELLAKRKQGSTDLPAHLRKNGKKLLVYLSSSGHLYGAVTQKTYKLFIQGVRASEEASTDLVIIGTSGEEMYKNSNTNRPYAFYDIPETGISLEHIKILMAKFLPYEKVEIYYGKFGNVITQDAIETSISGEEIFETEVKEPITREDRFIFEPKLEKIFHFFETHIMANLFSQTLLENQLARHASRVNAMEEALIHIEEESKRLKATQIKIKHATQNKKQLETVSGALMGMSS